MDRLVQQSRLHPKRRPGSTPLPASLFAKSAAGSNSRLDEWLYCTPPGQHLEIAQCAPHELIQALSALGDITFRVAITQAATLSIRLANSWLTSPSRTRVASSVSSAQAMALLTQAGKVDILEAAGACLCARLDLAIWAAHNSRLQTTTVSTNTGEGSIRRSSYSGRQSQSRSCTNSQRWELEMLSLPLKKEALSSSLIN